MAVMIQIRNVPESIHRTFKARSTLAGKSLSDLLLGEPAAIAALPSAAELRAPGRRRTVRDEKILRWPDSSRA